MDGKVTEQTIPCVAAPAGGAAVSRFALPTSEWIVAGFGLCILLLAQLMLSRAIHDTNYFSGDGKYYQATIRAALDFGGLFNVTNFNPLGGAGSVLHTLNVWANPAYWPFAILNDLGLASDISALIALGCLMAGCYVMVRCFGLPVVPSVVAAQCCIVLFPPVGLLLFGPANFALHPGPAVVLALQSAALGLLSRLEPGSWRRFGLTTGAIFAALSYGLYCDPLWTTFYGISLAVAFAVVTFASRRLRTMLVRAAALGCCFAAFLASGVFVYLYALSEFTARVFFPAAVDRVHAPSFVSALAFSPNMKAFYLACLAGWLLGLLSLRGRPRLLAATAVASFGCYVAYSVIYLLIEDAAWVLPIPLYVEEGLLSLYLTAAVAGYWGAGGMAASSAARLAARIVRVAGGGHGLAALPSSLAGLPRTTAARRPAPMRLGALMAGVVMVALIPAAAANYALNRAGPVAESYASRLPDEPEFAKFFAGKIGMALGRPFRGSVLFWSGASWDGMVETDFARAVLWPLGVPLMNDYTQLVTPQAIYLIDRLFQPREKHYRNHFMPFAAPERATVFWNAVQMLGARYAVNSVPLPAPYDRGYPLTTLPHRPFRKEPGLWYVHELPHPNTGDYSPTEVVVAPSAPEMIAAMERPDFDFTRTAVLPMAIREALVPAAGMRMSPIRDGWHISGRSDGTSLVVLPQQFSHCLSARDPRVRVVRADLMATGLIFSGTIDTDLAFEFGIFSPLCRLADIKDARQLRMQVDYRVPNLRGSRLLPDWHEAMGALRAAATAFRLN